MTPQERAQVVALLQAYTTARGDLTERLLAQLGRLVGGMRGKWYDKDALTVFHAQAAQLVSSGQKTTGNLTFSYLRRTLQVMDAPTRADAFVLLDEDLRAAEPEVEWERPAKEYRRLRVTGLDEVAAQTAAEQRAMNQAVMDLRLADRSAARTTLVDVKNVTGFRRIIRPELSKTGTCGLCLVAADRVYSRSDLLPLHGGCNCTVMPVTQAQDPGLNLNKEDLRAIYDAAGSTERASLRRIRTTVNEHGELGPILTRKGEHFRDASEVKHDLRPAEKRRADPTFDAAERARGELRALEQSLAGLEERAAAGEDVAAPLAYQRSRVEQLRRVAAGEAA